MDEQKKQVEPQLEKYRPGPKRWPAVISLLSSIAAGACWYFRDFQFRHAITAGQQGQRWFMLDANVALRRGLLIFAVIAIITGFIALTRRGKFFDYLAFILAVIICLTVGWVVLQMGGRGFWMAN